MTCRKLLCLLTLVCCTLLASADAAQTVWHGSRDLPQIAVTVDDCYDRGHLEAVIALCEQYAVPVTFFPVGNALKYADAPLWQRALDAGCEIGNHTWAHKRLVDLNGNNIRFQLSRTQQKLDELLGFSYPLTLLRPPYGDTNARVRETAAGEGYRYVVLWDVSQTDPDKAFRNVRNGSILLYHTNARDVRCLRQLIPRLLDAGYRFVTVTQLLAGELSAGALLPPGRVFVPSAR